MTTLAVATKDAYRLIHDGALALSQVEANGMLIDVTYLDRMIAKTRRRIEQLSKELQQDEIAGEWRKVYGLSTNYGSRQQLGDVLFDRLGYESVAQTESGRQSTDASALESLDVPFVQSFLEIEKLKKLHTTYLKGIRREAVNGILRPSFNLHTTKTYRSSSQDPNFQNQPVRDPFAAKLIRRAFIPREGRLFLEIDYSAIEVRIAACYHKDPTMLDYITSGHDMHKDMAMEVFKLKASQVSKPIRHTAKNGFVFPEFYGDYHVSIAKGIWDTINRHKMETTEGVLLTEHLKSKGITCRGNCEHNEPPLPNSLEAHLRRVEKNFWDKRFPKYKAWRQHIWDRYQKQGHIRTKTGFVVQGVMLRNEVINFPVQGSAFHCLLWSLIHVQKWLTANKMQTLIVGQIHDSLILDVVPSELPEVLAMARQIMTVDLRKHWDWIITPLDIEAEGSYENWYAKEHIAI